MNRLGLRRWKTQIRERAEIVWKSRWAGVVFLSCFAAATGCLEHRIPSPGVSVALMGVAAALMTARIKATGIEKAAWMIVISGLLVVEVMAIRKDRKEHDEVLATLIAGVNDNLKMQTGGDSFAYITFTPEPPNIRINQFPPTSDPQFLVSITSHGKYPLREIHATMMDDGRRLAAMKEYNRHLNGDWMNAIQSGDTRYQYAYLRPQSPEGPTGDVELLGMYPFPKEDSSRLSIEFSSLNGYWDETLHLGRINGTWHQCLSVMGPTIKQAGNPFIYCDSVWPEGRALAEKDWAHP
jgi:hypothetical protein